MRSEKEMFNLFLDFAKCDERIRIVGMEGSRTNVNIPKDCYQDYDITYFVTDMDSFIKDENWIDVFGKRIILQKPDAMTLFSPGKNVYSYLFICDDDVKIDLSIMPLFSVDEYLNGEDKLIRILLDKDGKIPNLPIPTDEAYRIKKPSANYFDDCCNEFWFVSTYIAKGLLREELLFASWHMEQIARVELLRMLSWKIGLLHGYGFSLGKHYKFIYKYISENEWDLLMKTYCLDAMDNCWKALESAHQLFRQTSKYLANELNYIYPDYDLQVTNYINRYKSHNNNIGNVQKPQKK